MSQLPNPPQDASTRTFQPEDPPFPRVFGKYLLLRKLGEGGMGLVYEAQHSGLNRRVALKVIKGKHAEDPGLVERFLRERHALGKIQHAHVVYATDAGEVEFTPYLEMEYLEGCNLDEYLDQHGGPLSVNEACELVRQAALGLCALEQAGLVHRDIKPKNLFRTSDGKVKVLDLGLVKQQAVPTELTETQMLLGTYDYISPEQCRDARNTDARSDVYSLGCTLYKLLAGHAPYTGPNYRTAQQKILGHAQDPFPRLPIDTPAEAQRILDRMVSHDRAQSYAGSEELVRDLGRFLAPQGRGAEPSTIASPVEAPTVSMVRPPMPVSPTRWRWLVGVMAVALLGGSTVLAVHLMRPPADEKKTPAPVEAAQVVQHGEWSSVRTYTSADAKLSFGLLAQRPVEIFWPRGDNASSAIYLAPKQALSLNCQGTGMIPLGWLRDLTCRVHFDLEQPGLWNCPAAVFFGYQEWDAKVAKFQSIGVRKLTPPGAPSSYQVYRTVNSVQDFSTDKSRVKPGTQIADEPITSPEGKCRLTLEFKRRGESVELERVLWDRLPLPGLMNGAGMELLRNYATSGGFGVLCSNSSFTVRHAELDATDPP